MYAELLFVCLQTRVAPYCNMDIKFTQDCREYISLKFNIAVLIMIRNIEIGLHTGKYRPILP